MNINRRFALGLGTVAAATAVLGSGSASAQTEDEPEIERCPTTAERSRKRVAQVYKRQVRKAKGTWSSYITVADPNGAAKPAVEEDADRVVEAYSVNKIAVAVAVLDKVDRGLIKLTDRVEVTESIVIQDTDGIFALDGAYPSSVTVGHALAALLTVSDNTAVRLCGLVVPAKELNEILKSKGFVHTQVVPVANPNRFFLGTTTPREMHMLLTKLTDGTLLSPASTQHLLNVLRSLTAFTDGVRLNLSSDERLRVATKAGWFDDGRNEAGVMFSADGRPILIYSLFASGEFDGDKATNDANFAFSHPAVAARAELGRTMYDAVLKITTVKPKHKPTVYRMVNGG
ncbi:serine hydrolase [Lentzea sp. NBRC 105346]|uniref:serine hydrolase n=1 Tax=Lentzea sp. NBRC 105346 TaxID=3032205 RepID=UPI0024A3C03D|nr:serine hydrolase [Lentzea sp. NBRC 105346]GLZ34725.1 serine hydrolase [Lentzea sp. NBRC 105346]